MKILSKVLLRGLAVSAVLFGVIPMGFTTSAPVFVSPGNIRYIIQTPTIDPVQLTALSRWLEKKHFDVAGLKWHLGQIEVITSPEGVAYLKRQGLKGAPRSPEAITSLDSRYLNPATLETKLRAVAQAYPNLTRLVEIGKSIQGRSIWALLLSDTPNPQDPAYAAKPVLVFDGLHHAREVMSAEVVADVADTMLKTAQVNQTAQGLLHRWNIWLIPMVNVDGSNIVFNEDSMWRKNAHGDQSRVYGVDINRNYPYRWSGCNGSSDQTDAQDYHGASQGSEPETLAMVNFGNAVRPTASLSYHSYSEFVLYPYGCHGDYTGDRVLVAKIGKELASILPSDDKRGTYQAGTPWELLYDVDGSSMDFFYASYGTLAYTFEINQEFQPPYSLRDATLVKERKAWEYFLTRIDQNLLHVIVVDGKVNRPAESLIGIDTINNTKDELPFKTNKSGHYFKVLDPGKYTLTATLADGRKGEITVQMAGKAQTITLNVQ